MFIIEYNEKVIGAYNNYELLNDFILSCTTNNFINKDLIKILEYKSNTCFLINLIIPNEKITCCHKIYDLQGKHDEKITCSHKIYDLQGKHVLCNKLKQKLEKYCDDCNNNTVIKFNGYNKEFYKNNTTQFQDNSIMIDCTKPFDLNNIDNFIISNNKDNNNTDCMLATSEIFLDKYSDLNNIDGILPNEMYDPVTKNVIYNQNITKNKENKENKEIFDENDPIFLELTEKKRKINHNINILKNQKKKIEEKKQMYNGNLQLFNLFSENIKKNKEFKIPPLFQEKYNIFLDLKKDDKLDYDNYIAVYDKIHKDEDYNNFFTSNQYNESFEKTNNEKNVSEEFEI